MHGETLPYARTIQQVRESVIRAFAALDSWFDQPADVRALRPANGGWTIDEVLEHVTLTNHYLLLVMLGTGRLMGS